MINLIKREFFVGNTCQTIGFYMVLVILLFITYLQFKEMQRQKQIERLAGTDGRYLDEFEKVNN